MVETRSIADQVNAIGRMDAVIHNAGIYTVPNRPPTPERHASTLAVEHRPRQVQRASGTFLKYAD